MRIVINDRNKAAIFCTIFGNLKTFSESVSVYFTADGIHVQSMDNGHVMLYDVNLSSSWFDEFELDDDDDETLGINCNIMSRFLATRCDGHSITISTTDNPDKLKISFNSSNPMEVDKELDMSLMDCNSELMNIPNNEYQTDITMSTKILTNLVDELAIINDNMRIECSEEAITLRTNGMDGDMKVNIPIDDLDEYATEEDEITDLSFSLGYLKKMCTFNKISTSVEIHLAKEWPMLLVYKLNENSKMSFYLAPKIDDDE